MKGNAPPKMRTERVCQTSEWMESIGYIWMDGWMVDKSRPADRENTGYCCCILYIPRMGKGGEEDKENIDNTQIGRWYIVDGVKAQRKVSKNANSVGLNIRIRVRVPMSKRCDF